MCSEILNLDLTDIKLQKGQTPQDIDQKCHIYCRDYMWGVWTRVPMSAIRVTRIYGGQSNQMYRCRLVDSVRVEGDEPRDVVIKLYGDKYFNTECAGSDRHNDAILASIMSEHGLGPRIYQSWTSGEIQPFLKHRQFGVCEQNEPKLVRELAQKLATFHSLKPPVDRKNNWLLRSLDNNMEKAYKKFPIDKLMADLKLDAITTDGLRLELEWLREIMASTESVVCFVHNDFRPNNILVLDANDGNDNPNDNQIIFCDFECSGYGFRGTDLGSLFAEWNREGLESYTRVQNFPNDFIVKSFIEEYIRESIRLNGDKFSEDSRNSCQHIIKETKVFTLVSNLYFITASLVMDQSPDMEVFSKTNLMYGANFHFKNYLYLKQKFIEDNAI